MKTAPPDEGVHTMSPISVEPGAATLQVGGPTPMFSYLASDGRWHPFKEFFDAAGVILVFAPSGEELAAIERLRPAFHELGVRCVPVLGGSTRLASSAARRAGFSGAIVSDPMSAIAGLFHTLDAATRAPGPSYFVIDSKRRLRALYYGPIPPAELLLASAARGLGLPLPASVFTTTTAR